VPDDASRAILLALLLADKSGIETDTMEAFRETGLMHLLAVSGLHVALVGLALFAFLKPILGRLGVSYRRAEWTRAAVTLALLVVYALVTGGSVSVVRAVVMTAVVLVGRAMERRVDTLNALAFAAIGLLVWRPEALFEVGFQLSFGAVAALVTLSPVLNTWVPEAWTRRAAGRWLVASVVASTAATLGTAPALLVHFGRLPLAGLILNAPAIPLTGAALGSALAAAVTYGVAPGVASLFGAFASAATQGLLVVSAWGADALAWSTLDGYLDNLWVVAAMVGAMGAVALARRPVASRRVALAAAALGVVGLGASVPEAAPRLDAVFLDVGQGDATLLSLPGGGHVLIDAGVASPYGDEGARTVVPHLRRYGVRRLDALVLTHADADHIGGAASVLRAVAVGRLVVNGQHGETDLWRETLRIADSLGVPVVAATAGDTLAIDPAVQIRVLGPTRSRAAGGDANEASVVLHVRYGATRWLLTGDAEHGGEADLVARYGSLLDADVVKVGHHGSRTSSTPGLVAAAGRPQWAVVSVAARNRYGLPDAEPLMRWHASGAAVVQTADAGAVWLRSDGATITRVDWRGDAE
jgi:competence protein ComEC